MSDIKITTKNDENYGCSCNCGGCLMFLASLFLLIFFIYHMSNIWIFLENLIK